MISGPGVIRALDRAHDHAMHAAMATAVDLLEGTDVGTGGMTGQHQVISGRRDF